MSHCQKPMKDCQILVRPATLKINRKLMKFDFVFNISCQKFRGSCGASYIDVTTIELNRLS